MPDRPARLGLVAGLALSLSGVAYAVPPANCANVVDGVCAGGVPELIAARGLSLGAYRGVVAGNDGIFTNSASLAARRRYSIEANWLLERASSDTAFQSFGASVVDSETTAVTGGFAYTRVVSGPWIGNAIHVPLAFPVTSSLFFGLTGKFLTLSGPEGDGISAANLDLSAFYRSGGIGVGVAGYNLFDSGHVSQMPRGFGAGISYGNDRTYTIAGDYRADFQRLGHTTNLFAVGGEVLVANAIPLRASFLQDDTRGESYWSAGSGFVSGGGFALDLGYRQSFHDPADRTFAATIKLFLSSH